MNLAAQPGMTSGASAGPLPPLTDPDAAAYVAAVLAAGAIPSATQRDALDAFYIEEKAQGRWALIKELYFPIWANAAANAVDMVTLAVGAFNGSITHGPGWVQGDGVSAWFKFVQTPTEAGMTPITGHVVAMVYEQDTREDTRYYIGVRNGGGVADTTIYYNVSKTAGALGSSPTSAYAILTEAQRTGIYCVNRNTTHANLHNLRDTAHTKSPDTLVGDVTIATYPLTAMAFNNVNVNYISPSDAKLGCYGMGLGFAGDADVQDYLESLQTLWDACVVPVATQLPS